MVVATLLVLAGLVMLAHEGTLNSSVSSIFFQLRQTARGEAPKPEMVKKIVSGMAMFPPMAVKW